jgi:hypothetical protein
MHVICKLDSIHSSVNSSVCSFLLYGRVKKKQIQGNKIVTFSTLFKFHWISSWTWQCMDFSTQLQNFCKSSFILEIWKQYIVIDFIVHFPNQFTNLLNHIWCDYIDTIMFYEEPYFIHKGPEQFFLQILYCVLLLQTSLAYCVCGTESYALPAVCLDRHQNNIIW